MKKLIIFLCVVATTYASDFIYETYNIKTIESLLNMEIQESVGNWEKKALNIEKITTNTTFIKEKGAFFVDDANYEELLKFIKSSVLPDSWNEQTLLQAEKGVLHLRHTKQVHEKVCALLIDMERVLTTSVKVELEIRSVPSNLFAVDNTQNKNLVFRGIFALQVGRHTILSTSDKESFLLDYDVEIATGSEILDPIISEKLSGIEFNIRPFLSLDQQNLYIFGDIKNTQKNSFELFNEKDIKNIQLPNYAKQGTSGLSKFACNKNSVWTFYSVDNDVFVVSLKPIVHAKPINNLHDISLLNSQFLFFHSPRSTENIFDEPPVGVVLVDPNIASHYEQILKWMGKNIEPLNFCERFVSTNKKNNDELREFLVHLEKKNLAIHKAIFTSYYIDKENISLSEFTDNGELTAKGKEWLLKNNCHIDTLMVSGINEQQIQAYSMMEQNVVLDYDVEVAQQSFASDPVVTKIREGIAVHCEYISGTENDLVKINMAKSILKRPIKRVDTSNGSIYTPELTTYPFKGTVTVLKGKEQIIQTIYNNNKLIVFTMKVLE